MKFEDLLPAGQEAEWTCGHVGGAVCAECYRRLAAKALELEAAHHDIIRKYERIMQDPPEWTSFQRDQLKWAREAWYGAASISRRAIGGSDG